ncbi:MAG: response regulator [Thermoanaerobaculia bacterium]|nr:response regulator [Thermoanaerobaculia bacterium]
MANTDSASDVSEIPGLREQRESDSPIEILVVDDNPANITAIEAALGDFGGRIERATSGREALRHLLTRRFAVILLDVRMPDLDGFETARIIRGRPSNRHIPIIFVTAYSHDDEQVLRGYGLGAVDFLFKPIVPEVLRAKVGVFVELKRRTLELRQQTEQLRNMERRALDRKLLAERQRWEAERLRLENQRKDEFIAVLAHELRNPLAPLVTGLELIRAYGSDREEVGTTVAAMDRQVRHLTRLVDDLLDVSRISSGKITLKKTLTRIDEVIEQAVDSVRPMVEEAEHELVQAPPSERLTVDGDPVRLTQVVSNLLSNACRYTDNGGSIRLSWGRDGDHVAIRVADNGQGISREVLERVFDVFVQEQTNSRGLGLGLTLVKQLIELHGGHVRAFSQGRGKGSEFVVWVPLSTEVSRETEHSEDESEAQASNPKAIVLIEDEEDVRETMRALLETWGHSVVISTDGREGLETVLDQRPDIAIVDIGMPGMDGYEVARKIREKMPGDPIRVIALTGFGREEDMKRARKAGFDEHIMKPARPEDLQRALRGEDGDSIESE